jgi:hypothetical protein
MKRALSLMLLLLIVSGLLIVVASPTAKATEVKGVIKSNTT